MAAGVSSSLSSTKMTSPSTPAGSRPRRTRSSLTFPASLRVGMISDTAPAVSPMLQVIDRPDSLVEQDRNDLRPQNHATRPGAPHPRVLMRGRLARTDPRHLVDRVDPAHR